MTDQTSIADQARALFAQERYGEAAAVFKCLSDQNPEDAAFIYNLGVTLARLDRFEEALACYRRAIDLNPSFAHAYVNFASCLNELGLIAQARQGFAIARTLAPEDPIPVLNEGIAALALGDYAAGWQGFAARWQLPAYAKFRRSFDRPEWHGENLNGKRLFLYAEQGFGDSIQMARFVPLLAAQGATVIVEVPPALKELMQSADGAAQIIAKGDPVPAFDTYCAMMDIPAALGIGVNTIPSATPYLQADRAVSGEYKNKLPLDKIKKIGLAWAGRSSHENDRNRSLPLAQLSPLLARENIAWVSLQRIVPEQDRTVLQASQILEWGQALPDFAATAALIEALDLVIAVDSAVAHLAGALGKPVWVLLPFYADWRWLTQRQDSPWYPSARLFRQQKRRDWDEVITRIAASL